MKRATLVLALMIMLTLTQTGCAPGDSQATVPPTIDPAATGHVHIDITEEYLIGVWGYSAWSANQPGLSSPLDVSVEFFSDNTSINYYSDADFMAGGDYISSWEVENKMVKITKTRIIGTMSWTTHWLPVLSISANEFRLLNMDRDCVLVFTRL